VVKLPKIECPKRLESDEDSSPSEPSAKEHVKKLIIRALSKCSKLRFVVYVIILQCEHLALWDLLLNIIRIVVIIFMIRGVVIGTGGYVRNVNQPKTIRGFPGSLYTCGCPGASVLPVAVIFGCMTVLVYVCLGLIVEYANLPYNYNAYNNVQNIFAALIVTNIFIGKRLYHFRIYLIVIHYVSSHSLYHAKPSKSSH